MRCCTCSTQRLVARPNLRSSEDMSACPLLCPQRRAMSCYSRTPTCLLANVAFRLQQQLGQYHAPRPDVHARCRARQLCLQRAQQLRQRSLGGAARSVLGGGEAIRTCIAPALASQQLCCAPSPPEHHHPPMYKVPGAATEPKCYTTCKMPPMMLPKQHHTDTHVAR